MAEKVFNYVYGSHLVDWCVLGITAVILAICAYYLSKEKYWR
jgi:uncharacterized membrane protein